MANFVERSGFVLYGYMLFMNVCGREGFRMYVLFINVCGREGFRIDVRVIYKCVFLMNVDMFAF